NGRGGEAVVVRDDDPCEAPALEGTLDRVAVGGGRDVQAAGDLGGEALDEQRRGARHRERPLGAKEALGLDAELVAAKHADLPRAAPDEQRLHEGSRVGTVEETREDDAVRAGAAI